MIKNIKIKKILAVLPVLLLFLSCSQKLKADLFVYNGTIYTVDSSFSTAEAMVVADGKILETGKRADLEKNMTPKRKLMPRENSSILVL